MDSNSRRSCVLIWTILTASSSFFLTVPSPVAAAAPARKQAPDLVFERQVKPILTAQCARCHAGKKIKGKLDLSTRDSVLLGGKSGPSVVPGKAKDSLLLEVVLPDGAPHMPPKRQLAAAQITTITKWINGLKAADVAAANAQNNAPAVAKRKGNRRGEMEREDRREGRRKEGDRKRRKHRDDDDDDD